MNQFKRKKLGRLKKSSLSSGVIRKNPETWNLVVVLSQSDMLVVRYFWEDMGLELFTRCMHSPKVDCNNYKYNQDINLHVIYQ